MHPWCETPRTIRHAPTPLHQKRGLVTELRVRFAYLHTTFGCGASPPLEEAGPLCRMPNVGGWLLRGGKYAVRREPREVNEHRPLVLPPTVENAQR